MKITVQRAKYADQLHAVVHIQRARKYERGGADAQLAERERTTSPERSSTGRVLVNLRSSGAAGLCEARHWRYGVSSDIVEEQMVA